MTVSPQVASGAGLTRWLAEQAQATRFDRIPGEVVQFVQQCVLDYLGVTLAGAGEPVSEMVYAELAEQGGAAIAHVLGRGDVRLPALSAALANGTASHALDFDDVNLAMPGHPTVAILPALLALAEEMHAGGEALVAAFVAGYELQCRLGRLVAPRHYDGGFHATGTIGTFGAAAACAHLMQLDAERAAMALGIAGTQAAGLRSMFGTMCKPFHAGKAAANGLLAARLARRGFESRPNAIERAQGFALTHSPDFHAAAARADPPGGFYLRQNLFKYHASCYLTHATIEATGGLCRAHRLAAQDVRKILLRLDRSCAGVCNIADPKTGLETKFSLRHTCAMALAGVDTAALASYSDAAAIDPTLAALRQKVTVEFVDGWESAVTEVEMQVVDGRCLTARHDAGIAASDVAEQGRRVIAKFVAVAAPHTGMEQAAHVVDLTHRLSMLDDAAEILRACRAI